MWEKCHIIRRSGIAYGTSGYRAMERGRLRTMCSFKGWYFRRIIRRRFLVFMVSQTRNKKISSVCSSWANSRTRQNARWRTLWRRILRCQIVVTPFNTRISRGTPAFVVWKLIWTTKKKLLIRIRFLRIHREALRACKCGSPGPSWIAIINFQGQIYSNSPLIVAQTFTYIRCCTIRVLPNSFNSGISKRNKSDQKNSFSPLQNRIKR